MIISIFLADDHAIVRDGVQMLLDGQPDMKVVGTAADGRDAVRQISLLRPHVAIMDVTMPELNGIDAAEQVREKSPSTRVLMLSTHSDMLRVFRALRAGASGYVMKESGGEELISAVRAVHRGGRHLSEPIAEAFIDDYVLQNGIIGTGDPLSKLSAREKETLALVIEGKTVREIGTILGLSPKTAHTYRYRIMEKLSIPDLPGLVRFGIENGLISLEGPTGSHPDPGLSPLPACPARKPFVTFPG